jgi:hypothetical protein
MGMVHCHGRIPSAPFAYRCGIPKAPIKGIWPGLRGTHFKYRNIKDSANCTSNIFWLNCRNCIARQSALRFPSHRSRRADIQKGDIIEVLESVYKDWWKGTLRGQIGMFPLNHVEKLADYIPEDLQRKDSARSREA